MENPTINGWWLGVPLFQETSIYICWNMFQPSLMGHPRLGEFCNPRSRSFFIMVPMGSWNGSANPSLNTRENAPFSWLTGCGNGFSPWKRCFFSAAVPWIALQQRRCSRLRHRGAPCSASVVRRVGIRRARNRGIAGGLDQKRRKLWIDTNRYQRKWCEHGDLSCT